MTTRLRTVGALFASKDHGTSTSDETILPPCAGLSWLFDSTNIGDHIQARVFCDRCDVIDWCAKEFADVFKETIGVNRHSGPSGTWAGTLYDAKSKPVRVRVGRCKDCGKPMLPGSSSVPHGYVTHQAHGYCEACTTRRSR